MNHLSNKISPLFSFFESLGFLSEQRNGTSQFFKYSSVDEEYQTLNLGVGIRDISDIAILEMRGKDVLDFLHRISTNNLKSLPAFESLKSIFTSDKGRILDCVQILNFGDFVFLCGLKGNEYKLIRWIEKYIINDEVNIMNAFNKYCILELLGPQANSFITLLFGKEVDEMKENQIKELSLDDYTFYVLSLNDENSDQKYWIISNPEYSKKIIDYSLSYKSAFQLNMIGDTAFQQFRIENGIPSINELNDLFNPYEINLKKYIDFKKGCYIGQEVIARLSTYNKIQRCLKGIVLDSIPDQLTDLKLFDDNKNEVGIITSLFPVRNKLSAVGLAVINNNNAIDGAKLLLKLQDNFINVFVKNIPFKIR